MKIAVFLWETQKIFNVPENISSDIFSMTKKFVKASVVNSPLDTDYFEIKSLNDIKKYKNYDKYIIMSNGVMLFNHSRFWKGISNQESQICGHILNLGEGYSLHEQFIMFDKEIFNILCQHELDCNLEYKNDNFVDIVRSKDNVHDDYTPLWIKWSGSTKPYIKKIKEGINGTFENIIDIVLRKGYTIENINTDIRNSKFYTYHTYKPEKFYENLYKKELQNDMFAGHKSFFEIFDNSYYVWAYNTEKIVTFKNNEYDTFVGVASGPNPWLYITLNNFVYNSKIYLIDINPNLKTFCEWFIDQDEEIYKLSWSEIFEKSPISNVFAAGDIDLSNELWNKNKHTFIENLEKIKSFKYEFIVDDLITYDNLENIIKSSQKPLVWFSNIFSYFETFEKNYQDFHIEYFLYRILSSNMNSSWVGNSVSTSKTITSPIDKNIDKTFYKEVSIPKFDSNVFLTEINNLEKKNLFTKHRSEYNEGWESFTLHGTAYNNTETNDPNKDHWTKEALENCPQLVDYIKNSKIKDSYARVRIMKLKPHSCIGIHSDDFFSKKEMWGLNISINNPEDCKMHFWSESFDYLGIVPWEPGKCFAIKINNKHMVINNSNENRYHLIIHGKGGIAHDTY